jgi:hypothetical protein
LFAAFFCHKYSTSLTVTLLATELVRLKAALLRRIEFPRRVRTFRDIAVQREEITSLRSLRCFAAIILDRGVSRTGFIRG